MLKRDNASAPRVDLLVFGPPCQPWSPAGLQRGLRDHKDRGILLFASLDYIELRKPKCFVMEEVAALLTRHRDQLKALVRRMRRADYHVYYKLMDTYKSGVPQSRVRLYLVGIRADRDKGGFEFPKDLTHEPVRLTKLIRRKSTVGQLRPEDMAPSARRNYNLAMAAAIKKGYDPTKARTLTPKSCPHATSERTHHLPNLACRHWPHGIWEQTRHFPKPACPH